MTAVISGGLGDIGAAIARRLAATMPVAVADLAPHGDSPGSYHQVDVTDPDAIERWLDEVGVPTVVVPAAATVTTASPLELGPTAWRRELDVDLTGPFLLATAAARRMVAAGVRGNIVFVGSWAAHRPHPSIMGYSVAKAGVRMMSQCLALDLAPHGIRVNEVAPGYVDAGLSKQVFDADPGRREAATAQVPLRELSTADDVAGLVTFLASEAARHVTGATLVADGGLSLLS
jgi:NAD(P)-dependent dehydrogenase (short-subunit alcohol dehydrogenase family)